MQHLKEINKNIFEVDNNFVGFGIHGTVRYFIAISLQDAITEVKEKSRDINKKKISAGVVCLKLPR